MKWGGQGVCVNAWLGVTVFCLWATSVATVHAVACLLQMTVSVSEVCVCVDVGDAYQHQAFS